MRRSLLYVALLMIGFTAVACGLNQTNPPIPCDGTDFVCDQAEQLHPLGGVDLVCNMGYTLEDACQEYLGMLPPQAPIPDVCDNIPVDDSGTCQPLGLAGDPCAEDADCAVGSCTEGLCSE